MIWRGLVDSPLEKRGAGTTKGETMLCGRNSSIYFMTSSEARQGSRDLRASGKSQEKPGEAIEFRFECGGNGALLTQAEKGIEVPGDFRKN